MAQVEVPFSDDELAVLEKMARARHLSVPELIRRQMGIPVVTPAQRTDAEQWAKALAICGKFRSGCSDLAERHDDYLAEIYGS